MLLTRDLFREMVFQRDNHQCVICHGPAQDAHHIIERRLWPDGGYYLLNGASLCGEHHIAAEQTTLSCDESCRCWYSSCGAAAAILRQRHGRQMGEFSVTERRAPTR